MAPAGVAPAGMGTTLYSILLDLDDLLVPYTAAHTMPATSSNTNKTIVAMPRPLIVVDDVEEIVWVPSIPGATVAA